MKNRKYLFGSIATASAFCAALIFNSFIFPSMLAMTPEKGEMKSIPVTPIANADIDEHEKKGENIPDVNAISEQKAIILAVEAFDSVEDTDVRELPFKTRYVKLTADVNPVNLAKWSVAFYKITEQTKTIYSVTIDAFTGTVVCVSQIETSVSDDNTSDSSADESTLINDFNIYSYYSKKSHSGNIELYSYEEVYVIYEILDSDGLLVSSMSPDETTDIGIIMSGESFITSNKSFRIMRDFNGISGQSGYYVRIIAVPTPVLVSEDDID